MAWRKREAEDALAAAWRERGFPATRLRLPMVNGERDHFRRIESYLWRLLDDGPLLIPESGPERLRHVYSGDVVKVIARLLGEERTFGEAYNLAQYAAPTLADLVTILADLLGATPRLVAVTDADLQSRGLTPTQVSPFSDRWMSDMDHGKALLALDFHPEHLRHYLDKIVTAFLAHPPAEPPPNCSHRAAELDLAAEIVRQGPATPKAPAYSARDSFTLAEELVKGPPATQADLRALLERQGVEATTLAPLHAGPDGTVYRLVVRGERALDTWHALRALVAKTGYWPVLLGDEEWAQRHVGNIELAEEWQKPSAAAIITAADAINVPVWFQTEIDKVTEYYRPPRGAWPDEIVIREDLAAHNAWLGAPPDNELDILYQHGDYRYDAMLASGERLRGLVPLVYVALLPTGHGWQAPAYLRFGGWNDAPQPAEHVAVLRRWASRYGAEVLAMKFDTIELLIRRPPSNREQALAAAWECWAYAPDCLPGEYRRAAHSIEGLAAYLAYVRIWGYWWD